MSFKNKVANIFSKKEQKASRSGSLLVQWNIHQPQFTPRQYDRLADEGYKKNIIAYRCIKLVSQNAASVPFKVLKGGKVLDEHPLLDLLRKPNPMQGGVEYFESLYAYYLISGNAYAEALGPDGKVPVELWALRPDRMRIIPSAGGVPEAYRFSLHGKDIDYQVNPVNGQSKILHLKNFNPLDDWYGMSPLEAAAFSIDQHNDAAKWNASLLQTGGRPSGAIVYKPSDNASSDVMTQDQRENLRDELENFFTGARNAGRPLILEGGLEWQEMSLSPKDMDWLSGKDVSAREVALAFGIPPQLIGIASSQTFSNFEQARLAMYDDAVLPLLEHVKYEFNNWLCPMFGDDITVDFDIDHVEALSLRRKELWDKLEGANFLTINEKRKILGFEPLPENGDILQ